MAFAAATLAFCTASAAGAAPPTGNPKGLALLERIHGAYRTVPAVGISLRLGGASFDYKLALRSGIGVAAQVVQRDPSGTTTLVARWGGPTWVRDRGRSCWRRLAASSPQTITGLGRRFPDQLLTRVRAPQRTRTGWRLPVSNQGEPAVFVVDGKSLLIRSIVVATPQGRYVEKVSVLRPPPKLAYPKRRC